MKKGTDPYRTHCCMLHGCKYENDSCPIVAGDIEQKFLCEECTNEGITTLDQLQDKRSKKRFSGYCAAFGKEVSPGYILSKDCEITLPYSIPVTDYEGNIIGKGTAKFDKNGIQIRGVLE